MRSTKIAKLAQILLVAVLFAPLHLCADIYLEGYGGGMIGRSRLSPISVATIYNQTGLSAVLCMPEKKLSASGIGGIKFGVWFDDQGWLSCSGPCWLEHFGCYIDGSFNHLKYDHTVKQATICYHSAETGYNSGQADISLKTTGHSGSLAFMLAYRACTGDVQPYLAIGPAVLFARQCAELVIGPHEIDNDHFSLTLNRAYTIAPSKASKNAACAALDVGLHQMLADCLDLDYSFKYRYAPCCFNFCAINTTTGQDQLSLKHHYNLCSFQLGVGFHF